MNKEQQKFLLGLSHHIHPVVIVAGKGLSENVMQEIENALDKHELVKVKLRTDRDQRSLYTDSILKQTQADLIHSIGQNITLFRRNPEQPVIELP
jgi:RNA-binding protein